MKVAQIQALIIFTLITTPFAFNKKSIKECAQVLSERIKEKFSKISHESALRQNYEKLVEEEQFDPRATLKKSKHRIEDYLKVRAQFAYKAKISLEARSVTNDTKVNDQHSQSFIRFMSAKQGNDGTTIYESSHLGRRVKVNATRSFHLQQNANFYTLPTSSVSSAVHIPTPLYDRNEDLLRKIDWSDIDPVYRTNREETKDLAFQLFCSESGFMRYYPAASWFWDNQDEHLDLFDCRNTEWYINSATNSKNVLIMLDMSGSMLGQRYEVAKQTTEAILETLSHNDYFNIMTFSKTTYLLDTCNGTNGLLQATMRNKKALRRKMDTYTSEGKAEYEKALPLAFTTLLELKGSYSLHTREEMSMMSANSSVKHPFHVALPEHVLTASKQYIDSISNGGGDNNRGACENVIMLITDGAPSSYQKIFELYNADKKVRVFTFLVGDEAIDFNEVREMACNNRGYMVHVANMADVDEKIQHYIRRMSRVVGRHYKESGQLSWWTGVYRERLYLPRPEIYAVPERVTNTSFTVMNKMASRRKIRLQRSEARGRMFVTTVSYPVIVNETFMGVAAVNIPLTEIAQKSHTSNIGAKSYFFMLDQNGFVMVHPQLRPIDPETKFHKQNYNNMDLLELEISQNHNLYASQQPQFVSKLNCEGANYAECVEDVRKIVRKKSIECNNAEVQQLDILYATEALDRVYPQTNTYYSECIDHANFTLGLAVAKGDDYRIVKRQKKYDFGRVKMEWMYDKRWRLHPHWRYCFLNDTDTHMTKEEAFEIYALQMTQTGKAPQLCEYRRNLVEKLLLDLEATSNLISSWENLFKDLSNDLIHLAFFATPSGMIRYYNISLPDYSYIDNRWQIWGHIGKFLTIDTIIDMNQESYNNFITDLNRKSADDRYYKRAVRMKDTIMFDISNNSKIWYERSDDLTSYGLNENMTILGQAFKAIYLENAVIGVAGYEYAYDHIVDLMIEHGCAPSDDRKWCVLLDEHGYVFYSNQNDISYEDYLKGEGKHLSQFFGGINRVAQRAMSLLVENKFYTNISYTDNQAICKSTEVVVMSSTHMRPFLGILKFLMHTFNYFMRLSSTIFGNFMIYLPQLQFTDAYTASFHEGNDVYPCPKVSSFYFTNKDGKNRPVGTHLVNGNLYERPCDEKKCSVKMEAAFVEGTNLIMVWITQDKESKNCYDESQCQLEHPSKVPFGFEEINNVEFCEQTEQRKSKANDVCYSIDDDDSENERRPCSSTRFISFHVTIFFTIIYFL